MFKGKTQSKWDKFSGVEYINIPKGKAQKYKPTPVVVRGTGVSDTLTAVLFLGLSLYCLIKAFIGVESQFLYAFGGLISLIICVYFFYKGSQSKVIMVISAEGIVHLGKPIKWEVITNIYIKEESDGESFSSFLIIEILNKYKENIQIKDLDKTSMAIASTLSNQALYWKANSI